MTDEPKREERQEQEPELKRPDEAVRDLEPDAEEAETVKGGAYQAYMTLKGHKQG